MQTFKQFILEYLTPEQEKEYSKYKMRKRARKATDHFFGERNDEVLQPLDIEPDETQPKSGIHKSVELHLGKTLTHKEYYEGKTTDSYGRPVRIGRMIKDPYLQSDFSQDPYRSNATHAQQYTARIVRGVHVAGQTNPTPDENHPKGHKWKYLSCKNIVDGGYSDVLKDEIRHGTVAMFAKNKKGEEVYRATLQPHLNEKGHTVYTLDGEYGTVHPGFTKRAHEVAAALASPKVSKKYPVYIKHDDVYNDSGEIRALHPQASSKELTKVAGLDSDEGALLALTHPNVSPSVLHAALNSQDWSVRQRAALHSLADDAVLHKALKDYDYDVRSAAISNNNSTIEHLKVALNDTNPSVLRQAINHKEATRSMIRPFLKNESDSIRRTARARLRTLPAERRGRSAGG